jgi:acetyl-CoA synthetase
MDPLEHTLLLAGFDSYEQAREEFRWDPPETYNIATDLVESQPDPDRTALYYESEDGARRTYTFGDFDTASNRVARLLEELGVDSGDRVAVSLPKAPETLVVHLAVYKLGAVLVPLSELFGPESVEYRVCDSGATLLVTHEAGVADLTERATDSLDDLLVVDGPEGPLLERAAAYPPSFETVDTSWNESAMIIYTSGTTSEPKGVIHGHRHVPGYYPTFEMANGLLSGGDRVFWTPGDWAWVGSLVSVLYCAWHYGYPYVARPTGTFDPVDAASVVERYGVTNAFLVPTALKMMADEEAAVTAHDLDHFSTVATGGEPLPTELGRWAEDALGVDLVGMYGQTEANMLITSATEWFEVRRGWVGKRAPGAEIRLIDEDGEEVPTGEMGELAVESSHPTVLKAYLDKPDATAEKFHGDWMLTGDLVREDEDGYVTFESRTDDLIISSGYRISPTELEDAILQYEGVRNVAVVGRPDETRGHIVAAYVRPSEGADTDRLPERIQRSVREDLAAHKYPREVELIEAFPRTVSGKIKRDELGR